MSGPGPFAAFALAAALTTHTSPVQGDVRFDLTPTARQFEMYYPVRAVDVRRSGQALLDCVVQADATLGLCVIVSETPADLGFGTAGLRLSKLYRIKAGARSAGDHVVVPLDFRLPSAAGGGPGRR